MPHPIHTGWIGLGICNGTPVYLVLFPHTAERTVSHLDLGRSVHDLQRPQYGGVHHHDPVRNGGQKNLAQGADGACSRADRRRSGMFPPAAPEQSRRRLSDGVYPVRHRGTHRRRYCGNHLDGDLCTLGS